MCSDVYLLTKLYNIMAGDKDDWKIIEDSYSSVRLLEQLIHTSRTVDLHRHQLLEDNSSLRYRQPPSVPLCA